MLNTDKPITKRGEDFLNRKIFADNISRAIKNHDKQSDSLTIGLYGKWGSGKTSIVNMITEVLDTDENIIVFKFEPWIYSDTQQLISHFFREFAKVVKHKDYARDALRFGEELETYASFFEPMSLIPEPTVSFVSLASSTVFNSVAKASKKWGKLKTKNLSATKESIEKHLLKFDKKIVIIIDDIDRLNNTEIRQIFQMIKILGDFSNTIYISIMDRDVVVDALCEVQKGDGSEYLEKIIHVPFEVPAISQSDVLSFLEKNIREIIKEDKFDEERWWEFYHAGLKYIFQNIRDVKRYMNVLKFNFSAIGQEVNSIDLIAITAIQIFEPKVYEIIKNNKELFLGSLSTFDDEKKFTEDVLEKTFASFQKIEKKHCQEYLEVLFPNIGFRKDYREDRRKGLNICSGDFFDIYFQMTLGQNDISQEEMKRYIDGTSDEDDFKNTLIKLYGNGKLDRFLVRFCDYIQDDISKDKFQVIFNVFMELGETFKTEKTDFFYAYSNTHISKILSIFKQLFRNLKNEEKYDFLKIAIEKSDNLLMMCYVMFEQMKQYGEIEGVNPIYHENRTLSTEKFQDLKKLVNNKIEDWVKEHKLFEYEYGLNMWYLWVQIDEKQADKYKIEQLQDTTQLLRAMEKFINIHNEGYDSYESFNYDGFKKFINIETIIKQVEELDKNFDKYKTNDKSRFVIDGFLKAYDKKKENP